jgi:hypothetical protein
MSLAVSGLSLSQAFWSSIDMGFEFQSLYIPVTTELFGEDMMEGIKIILQASGYLENSEMTTRARARDCNSTRPIPMRLALALTIGPCIGDGNATNQIQHEYRY